MKRDERGFILPLTLVILTLLLLAGGVFLSLSAHSLRAVEKEQEALQLLNQAETGAQLVFGLLSEPGQLRLKTLEVVNVVGNLLELDLTGTLGELLTLYSVNGRYPEVRVRIYKLDGLPILLDNLLLGSGDYRIVSTARLPEEGISRTVDVKVKLEAGVLPVLNLLLGLVGEARPGSVKILSWREE